MIDFKVPKTENCVIIDTKNWIKNNSQKLTVYRMSGRDFPTYISKVISINDVRDEFKGEIRKDDIILLTRVSSEVAQYRTFGIDPDDERYYNVPIMQVIGTFSEGKIDIEHLRPLFDKIIIKKVDTKKVGLLNLPDSNVIIGEVVKTGWCKFDKDWNRHELDVKVGDHVLIRDNVTTEIFLSGETYYATEESMVVGIFKNTTYTLDNLEVISSSVLLESYIPNKVLESKFWTPALNYESEDVTDIYNRDLFKIVAVDKSLTKLSKGDIILVDRNITNYVYLGMDKYFILSGMDYIEAKVNV